VLTERIEKNSRGAGFTRLEWHCAGPRKIGWMGKKNCDAQRSINEWELEFAQWAWVALSHRLVSNQCCGWAEGKFRIGQTSGDKFCKLPPQPDKLASQAQWHNGWPWNLSPQRLCTVNLNLQTDSSYFIYMVQDYYWFLPHIVFIVCMVVLTYKMYVVYMNKKTHNLSPLRICPLLHSVLALVTATLTLMSTPAPSCPHFSAQATEQHCSNLHTTFLPLPCRSPVPFGFSSHLDNWQVCQHISRCVFPRYVGFFAWLYTSTDCLMISDWIHTSGKICLALPSVE
jgi:hypothetical protein